MATAGYLADGHAIVADDAELSGWWRRVGASLVDTLIVLVPLAALGALAGLGAGESAILGGYLATTVAALIYAPLLMARGGAHNGQTFGKQAAGIRVVREDGQPMTVSRGLVRDTIGKGLLGLVPLYGLVDALWPLGDGRNQAVHDKIGSTVVKRV